MKYGSVQQAVEKVLVERHIEFSRIEETAVQDLILRWMKVFVPHEKTGKTAWIFQKGQCFWHIFRSIKDYVSGGQAVRLYLQQHPTEFYVFGTNPLFGFLCKGPYVDFFHDDIYICHHNMKWTIFYTHEIANGLGPYYTQVNPDKSLKHLFDEDSVRRKTPRSR